MLNFLWRSFALWTIVILSCYNILSGRDESFIFQGFVTAFAPTTTTTLTRSCPNHVCWNSNHLKNLQQQQQPLAFHNVLSTSTATSTSTFSSSSSLHRRHRSSVISFSSASSAAAGSAGDAASSDDSSSSQASTKLTTTTTTTTTTDGTGGTATMAQEIFSLVKNIVGAGVLGLPAGIAAFGNAPSAVFPALLLIAGIGGLSAYGFALIGRVCALTSTKSYREAWSASVSEGTSWLPAVSVTAKTMCAILAYSMILAETCVTLLGSTWIPTLTKPTALVSLTTLVLLPLCLLKNLSSLAPFSLVGSLGMVYTALAMAGRWWTKSYRAVATTTNVAGKVSKAAAVAATTASPSSNLALSLAPALRPRFGTLGASGALTPQVAIFIGMLSTAYMAHFNAPKFYNELRTNQNSQQSQVERFAIVVATSFALSIGIFGAVAAFGFLTFGAASSGVILNNYANTDIWMNISRLAVTTSLIFSYPLAFLGFRDGVLDLFQVKQRQAWKLNVLTVGLLSMITVLALIIPDVSFVLSFAGATLGNSLIYILPAFMFRGAVQQQPKDSPNQSRLQREVKLALANAGLGAVMGLLGAKMAIQSLLLGK